MIIDYTYFKGKILLPQVGNAEGLASVNQAIADYEPEFLIKALGYDLWKAFMQGLQEVVIEQKWLDLLNGAEYVHKGYTHRWIGFAPIADGSTISVVNSGSRQFTVGGIDPYDPSEGTTWTLPPEYVGIDFSVSFRGTGKLRSDEYLVTGNQLQLLGGLTFNAGATIFLEKGSSITVESAGLLLMSPIAQYVYFKFRETNVTDTVLVGEVQSDTDNNRVVAPQQKMVDAWNRMADMLAGLTGFMNANKGVYPGWNYNLDYFVPGGYYYGYHKCPPDIYRKINTFDL